MASLARRFMRHAPSMKVPPKRKGNIADRKHNEGVSESLNESPSEKEGK